MTTGGNEGVFLVPQAAVLSSEQGKFVFVAETDKDGKTVAAVRPIQAGGWSGQDWVVLGGLKQGDKVIVDNLIKVRPRAPIDPKQPASKTNNAANTLKTPASKEVTSKKVM